PRTSLLQSDEDFAMSGYRWFTLMLLLIQHSAIAQAQLVDPNVGPIGSIHGSIAIAVPDSAARCGSPSLAPGFQIYLPDVQVTAKNTRTLAISATVVTNSEGQFRSPDLPPGDYQVCVSGHGYASTCENQVITVNGSLVVLNQTVLIH